MARPRVVGLVWVVAACLLVGALLVAVRSKANSFTRDLNSSGLVWLGSASTGQISQVSGSSGDVVASVPLFSANTTFVTHQLGSNGLAVVPSTGNARLVSGSTLQASGQLSLGGGQPIDQVVPTPTQAFLLGGGSIKVFDPAAMSTRGPYPLRGSSVDDAIVDGRGALWLLDAAQGSVRTFLNGSLSNPKRISGAGPGSRLMFDGDQVGVFTPNPPSVERVSGAGKFCVKELQGVADATPGSVDDKGSALVVLGRAEHRLVRVDLKRGTCRSVDLGADAGKLDRPVSVGSASFVPNDTGKVLRVDWSSATPTPQTALDSKVQSTVELLARGGYVYWNDPKSEKAGVLFPQSRDISKVDVTGQGNTAVAESQGGTSNGDGKGSLSGGASGQATPSPKPAPPSTDAHKAQFVLLQTEVKAGTKTPIVRDLSSPRPDKITWEWGDGSKTGGTPGDQATHTYDQPADYPVAVTATWGNDPPITSQPKQVTVVPKDATRNGDFVVDVVPPPTIAVGGQFTVNAHSTIGPAVDIISSSESICSTSKATSDSTRSAAQVTAKSSGTCSVEFRQPSANGINPANPVQLQTQVLSSGSASALANPSGSPATGPSTATSSNTTSSTGTSSPPSPRVPCPAQGELFAAYKGRLTAAGYAVAESPQASSQPVGTVLSTNPACNSALAAGGTVTVTDSSGPALVTLPCPNTTPPPQETGANYQARLMGLGFKVTATNASSTSVAAGLVISTNPTCGGQVPAGSAVSVDISTGPTCTVPDVTGLDQNTASMKLSQLGAGCTATVKTTTETSNTVTAGLVIRTNPAAGTVIPTGSTITMVVSSGLPPKNATVKCTGPAPGDGTQTNPYIPPNLTCTFTVTSGAAQPTSWVWNATGVGTVTGLDTVNNKMKVLFAISQGGGTNPATIIVTATYSDGKTAPFQDVEFAKGCF